MKWLFLLASFMTWIATELPAYADSQAAKAAKKLCKSMTKYQVAAGGLIPSYPAASDTDASFALKNVAFVYDNALASMAFLACGNVGAAKRIGDALVVAQNSDRFYKDGRLRNAYLAGEMSTPPKLPGRWNKSSNSWQEDEYQASTAVGNVAWAALALLQIYDVTNEERYLASARSLGLWISQFDTATGVTGGFSGFEPNAQRVPWKSTEHNIDTAAVAKWLTQLDSSQQWPRLYCSSSVFVGSMYRDGKGYLIGTTPDDKPNSDAGVYLDAQLWPFLAFQADALPTQWSSIRAIIDSTNAIDGGFDFNDDRDGVWMEGTAQAALVFKTFDDGERAQSLLNTVLGNRDASTGFILATDKPQISTKLTVGADGSGGDFNYYRWPHLGATAWTVLALTNFNPFTDQRGHHAVWDRKQCS